MAATMITMSTGLGPGQDETFYALLKPTLPDGYQLEDSDIFGLDNKATGADRTIPNEYTQV